MQIYRLTFDADDVIDWSTKYLSGIEVSSPTISYFSWEEIMIKSGLPKSKGLQKESQLQIDGSQCMT